MTESWFFGGVRGLSRLPTPGVTRLLSKLGLGTGGEVLFEDAALIERQQAGRTYAYVAVATGATGASGDTILSDLILELDACIISTNP